MRQLTVAHIDTQLTWRGGERQVLELIKGLTARDVKSYLICKPSSELSVRAGKANISILHLPLRGEWDVLSAFRLRSFLQKNKIDIVHAHTSHAHTLGILAAAGLKTCRLVVSRRVDFPIKNYFSKTLKYGSCVDKIITVSDAIRRILIEDGIDPERIVTIRSGFTPTEFANHYHCNDLRSQLKIPKKTVVIVTVAALAPHKAHHVLLKAAHTVIKKHPDVKFLLAGDGEMKKKIQNYIVNLGIQESVIVLGFVKDIAAVFKAADIFALSSREEGLCTSLLDAMYFGLPVITTNAGGIPELVKDEVNGLIVPVNDHILFAEKLNYLIENPERRKIMGSRSLEQLENNRIEKTIEKTYGVYKALLT